ncbi:MAG TPA: EthD domain-containing protein [Acidimicrobiales bacterium]|nr:EthD domain-containing protein [Acidimicrobiales bacterium]
MVKLVYCVRRRDDVDAHDFHRYWLENHGPLVRGVADALRAVKYVQSHTIDTGVNEALRQSRGLAPAFDGITEVWWDRLEDLEEATTTTEGREAARRLLEDESNFIDFSGSALFMTEEFTIFDVGA